MAEVSRGEGITPSERYLAQLADQTFLRLWSYPNTFFDKKQGGVGVGKELADLLAVCGDDVLIFSDKEIRWKGDEDLKLSWSRWCRSAIKDSSKQIAGAERWLARYPERIFLDAKCSVRFPIELPPVERRRVHGVIVASGATAAARRFFDDDSGTFFVSGDLKGEMHGDPEHVPYLPFAVGDISPDASFIHVFDPTAIEIVMRELDTMSDFAEYLTKRATFIRSGRFSFAAGEEDLLAFYLQTMGDDGAHAFIPKKMPKGLSEHQIGIPRGEYDGFLQTPAYSRRKEADCVSYVWDTLIDVFVEHVLKGTSVALLGHEPDFALSERGLRSMALENRVYRRILGASIHDALTVARDQKAQRFARYLLPGRHAYSRGVAYVFMIMNFADGFETYETYRQARSSALQIYCFNVLESQPSIETVVGIAVDSAPDVSGRPGGSEDLIAIDREALTASVLERLPEMRDLLGIRPLTVVGAKRVSESEFPAPTTKKTARQKRRKHDRDADRARRSALNPRK